MTNVFATQNVMQILVLVKNEYTKPLNEARKLVENIERAARKTQMALMSVGFSFLFTGMALKRFFEGMLRGIYNTYQLATDETSEFDVLTNRLIANWEFFKFTLMDALLQTGLFQFFINTLIGIVQWLSQLSPQTKSFLMTVITFGLVASTVMMILGQAFLFIIGLAALKYLGVGLVSGVVGLMIAVLMLVGVLTMVTSETGEIDKKMMGLALVTFPAAMYAALKLGAIWPLIVSGWLFAIGALIIVFDALKGKYGNDWWKVWLSGIVWVFLGAFGGILDIVTYVFRQAVAGAAQAAVAISEAFGKPVSQSLRTLSEDFGKVFYITGKLGEVVDTWDFLKGKTVAEQEAEKLKLEGKDENGNLLYTPMRPEDAVASLGVGTYSDLTSHPDYSSMLQSNIDAQTDALKNADYSNLSKELSANFKSEENLEELKGIRGELEKLNLKEVIREYVFDFGSAAEGWGITKEELKRKISEVFEEIFNKTGSPQS